MMTRPVKWFHTNRVPLLLFGIALALRVYGNGFGLPDEFHIDETHLVPRAIRFGAGDPDPHWYFYPPLYMYILFALYALYFVFGRLTGAFGSAADFGMQYFLDPTMFYLIGRTATAVLGASTVWLVYRIGERAWGRAAGTAAAALLALCALHVENSHYITTDVPLTFFVTLSLWFALAYTRGGRARDLAAAGFAVGLAMATKYTGVLAAAIPVLAVGVRWRVRGDEPAHAFNPDVGSLPRAARGLVLCGASAAAGFLMGCPWAVLQPHAFYTDVVTLQGENINHVWLGMEGIRNMWWHVPSVFLRQGMTLPVLLVCAAGLVWALRRRTGADVLVAGFTILFYLWVAHYKNYGIARYWVAALPMLCLAGGRLLADAAERAAPRQALQAAGVLALALSCASGWAALSADREMTLISTRTIAREWFCDNTPSGTRVAAELHGPMLKPTKEALLRDAGPDPFADTHVDQTTRFNHLDDQARPWAEKSITHKKHHLAALERTQCKFDVFGAFSLAEYPLSTYRENGVEYLAVNQYIYERYLAAANRYSKAAAFYRALDRDCAPASSSAPCELVAEFHPVPGRITGPEIKIYRLFHDAPPK